MLVFQKKETRRGYGGSHYVKRELGNPKKGEGKCARTIENDKLA